MWSIILGNILSLVALAFMILSTKQLTKKKMFEVQALEASISAVVNIILKGTSGAVVNSLVIIRNIYLSKKDTLGIFTVIFAGILFLYGMLRGDLLSISGLPILASMSYTIIAGCTTSHLASKGALALNSIMWLIYKFTIRDYVGSVYLLILFYQTIMSIRKEVRNGTYFENI